MAFLSDISSANGNLSKINGYGITAYERFSWPEDRCTVDMNPVESCTTENIASTAPKHDQTRTMSGNVPCRRMSRVVDRVEIIAVYATNGALTITGGEHPSLRFRKRTELFLGCS